MVDRIELIKFFIALITVTLLLASRVVIASQSTSMPACDEQSGKKQHCPFELPQETIAKLKIDAGFGWGIIF